MFTCELEETEKQRVDSSPTVGMKVSAFCAYLRVFVCGREEGSGAEWELGSAAPLSASGLSEKEFEVEDLRSPLRPHPCSQISC